MRDASSETAAFIRRFLLGRAPQAAGDLDLGDLDDDMDLFAAGLLDSMGLLEMISAIEERFGVIIDFSDLDLERFSCIGDWAALVDRSPSARPDGAP